VSAEQMAAALAAAIVNPPKHAAKPQAGEVPASPARSGPFEPKHAAVVAVNIGTEPSC
jgi:hypothetical protein